MTFEVQPKCLHKIYIYFIFLGPLFFCGACDCINRFSDSQNETNQSNEESVLSQRDLTPIVPSDERPVQPISTSNEKAVLSKRPSQNTYESQRQRQDLLQPQHVSYLGAFRLPEGDGNSNWEWSGGALAYNPGGDPGGTNDGYPGSLFGVGHDWQSMISEVTIPQPTIPQSTLENLKRAQTIQPFTDIKRGKFPESEIAVVGLQYLPGPQGKSPGVLHYCWGRHMQENSFDATHGWVPLDLSDEQIFGPFRIDDFQNYATNDYLFDIPSDWAHRYVQGRQMGTGRFREGGQGGRGPQLIAYNPYGSATNSTFHRGEKVPATPLILYRTAYQQDQRGIVNNYMHCDDWVGGAWLEAGDRSAVVFLGSKSQEDCWYGFSDGTRFPNPENRLGPGDRGFWATSYAATMLFYDPQDLARVARGELPPYSPQPYASLNLDQFLYKIRDPQMQRRIRSVTYDRERHFLYVLQFRADNDRSIIHVFRIQS